MNDDISLFDILSLFNSKNIALKWDSGREEETARTLRPHHQVQKTLPQLMRPAFLLEDLASVARQHLEGQV